MTGRRRTQKRRAAVLLALCVIVIILLIVLMVVIANRDRIKDVSKEPSQSTSQIPTQTESQSESASTQQESQKPSEVLPEPSYGKWDLEAQPNEEKPFGNNPDDVTAAGIPSGVFWYDRNWGQYNVDFVSDIAMKYNNGESTDKSIYLTMDCGFDNEETGPILDILKEKNVKATFFVTSMFYDARPDLIKRMIDEGHRIGSHSITHRDMPTLDLETQKEEIMDVVNKLKKDFNYDCRLFRFPEGEFSARSLALVDNLGMKSVFWTYAYNDFSTTQPPVQESYEKAVKYLHPGAIYLLHASSSTNRAFLADWIDAAREKGYDFAGVYPVD